MKHIKDFKELDKLEGLKPSPTEDAPPKQAFKKTPRRDVDERPFFDQSYVLRLTSRNIRRSIDISIRKTFDRVPEFAEDPQKSHEIFETLAKLHMLRKMIDDFQKAYRESFADTSKGG